MSAEEHTYPGGVATFGVPTATVAALAYLRQQTFPRLVEPPQFTPRARALTARPEWLDALLKQLARYALFAAAVAAIALVVATAVPAWAAIRDDRGATAPAARVSSSTGTTGTAATRIEDLSAATIVGGIPALQQARYAAALSGATSDAVLFPRGARQAAIADYVQDVSKQVALPYISNTIETESRIESWAAAVEEHERRAALSRQAAAAPAPVTVWQSTSIAPGTRIAGAHVTFYACIGNGFCGNMASGYPVFEGAAACSTNLPFGTKFIIANDPTQRIFTCLDRGALPATWVDVWFYDAADGYAWQSMVGSVSDIIIVE